MKKLLTTITVFAIGSLPLWGQLNISTNLTQYFTWDKETRGWVPSSEKAEDYTFFSFNEEYSMLKHTTSKMTSAYLVKSISKDTLDNNPLMLLDIVSDVGNQYLMIIDINDNTLRFIDEDFTFMKSQTIKNIWTDKVEQ